jgi:hypothetical protein
MVLGAIEKGTDPATLPPEVTQGFNLPLLKSLPRSMRDEPIPRKTVACGGVEAGV